jgi:hypothetical protein
MRNINAQTTIADEMISIPNEFSDFCMKKMTKLIVPKIITKKTISTTNTSKLLLIFLFNSS